MSEEYKTCKHGKYTPDGGCWEECEEFEAGYRRGQKAAAKTLRNALFYFVLCDHKECQNIAALGGKLARLIEGEEG